MASIKVDIDELLDKLNAMKEDDYVTTELQIEEDDYCSELLVSAVSFELDEPISYGSLTEAVEELELN